MPVAELDRCGRLFAVNDDVEGFSRTRDIAG